MGSRIEAVFDCTEFGDAKSYDPRTEYQRRETMIRLVGDVCCHVCLRSPPEVALMKIWSPSRGGALNATEPLCVECGESFGADPDLEVLDLEREQTTP